MIESEVSGYFIDNLDTKSIEEAQNTFERLFVHIRQVMERESLGALEDADLNVCHQIARTLSRKFKDI